MFDHDVADDDDDDVASVPDDGTGVDNGDNNGNKMNEFIRIVFWVLSLLRPFNKVEEHLYSWYHVAYD